MTYPAVRKHRFWMPGISVIAFVLLGAFQRVVAAPVDRMSLHVVVFDAETGHPINQARLTLQFVEPGGKKRFGLGKKIAHSAKTNPQGKYKFVDIPRGTVRLIVTAERHQSFGKDFELEEDNQVIEVKLKKPQPLL